MRSVILRLLALMAFSIGVMIGLSLPKEAEATQYTYYVWNQPGTNSSSATLTCGWHNDCTYGSDGDALDWMNSSSVYWRSLSSNSQGISWVGRVYVADLSWGSCYRTYAEVRTPLGTSLEGILYRHTQPSIPGSAPYVWSGLYPSSTSFIVGSSVANDCGYFPAHLHQERGSTNWTRNTYYPTRASCNNDYGCQTDNVWGQHHSQRLWYASGY
jgi:hypothetical protein